MDKNVPIGKFWWAAGYYAALNPSQRRGQATFNALSMVRPDLSEQIRGTSLDAFYENDAVKGGKLDAMCEWIEAHWKE